LVCAACLDDQKPEVKYGAIVTEHAHCEKAPRLIEQDDREGAMACVDEGLQQQPENSQLWLLKGVALGLSGNHAEALPCFERCIQLPDAPPYLIVSRAFPTREARQRKKARDFCLSPRGFIRLSIGEALSARTLNRLRSTAGIANAKCRTLIVPEIEFSQIAL
jgi:tetratricopeptide (TPR) repeat protein